MRRGYGTYRVRDTFRHPSSNTQPSVGIILVSHHTASTVADDDHNMLPVGTPLLVIPPPVGIRNHASKRSVPRRSRLNRVGTHKKTPD